MNSATESKLAEILRTLSNKDAIKIVRFAKSGFDSTSDAHKRLGLSVKRYYYRLQKLMDADLVTKMNDKYELTPLGKIACDLERRVSWAIENMDQIQIVEALKRSETIDDKTLEKVVKVFGGTEAQTVDVIKTYEELVDATVEVTERAVEKIYLATRFSEARAIEAGWRAIRRGVKIRVIDGDTGKFGRLKLVRMMLTNPKAIRLLYEVLHSNQSEIRHRDIPFSFVVVDDRVCCFEVINPAMNGFFAAIRFEDNENIKKKLMKSFYNLWERAGKDPLTELSEELMKEVEKI